MKDFIFNVTLCICSIFFFASLVESENKIDTNEESPGQGIILTPGLDLILQCNNTDNPSTEMNWYKNGLSINLTDTRIHIEKSNNTLSIVKTTEDDAGSYMCAINDKINATIVVRTNVKLGPFDNSRNVVQGQSIILVCNVTQGRPLPILEWYKNGELLNTSNPRIMLKSDQRGIEGTELIINEAEFEDRADYMCIATNDISSANATILVRVKDKYAALWPFLGICAEVAVLCTIIFIYEKKRQKTDYDESETEHNTENKNIPDQEEKSRDIRQRK